MPPSISISIGREPIMALTRRILSTTAGMNACPPKPGLTVISRMRSRRSSTYSITLSGVDGLSDTPARLPSARIACSERSRCGPASRVHGDDVGASLRKGREIGIGRRDHQMTIEDLRRRPADCLHHRRPERDVRHEMSIHHIEMDPVGPGGIDRAHLLAEPREIGGQDGRGNDQRPGGHGKRSLHRRLGKFRNWRTRAAASRQERHVRHPAP